MNNPEIRYELRIVYINPETKRPVEPPMCVIGTFADERELEKWAKENEGELTRC